jgi:aminoglycoside/choline kinase family phosphotransferase
MIGEDEEIVVIDFQDAKSGALMYDLVSLLRDVYVELDEDELEEYISLFKSLKGLEVDDKTLVRWFDFMGLQRHIKILGIFARLSIRDGKDGYLDDIPLTLKYVIDVASKYPQLDGLVRLLKSCV